MLRRRRAVQKLRLVEAFADFTGERACDDPSIRVDEQHHGRSDAFAVFGKRRAERTAVAGGRGFPERRIRGQQPGTFDQPLRIEFEQTLEGARPGHDFVTHGLADGRGGVHMNQDEAGRSHGDHQQHKRRQEARLKVVER